jgi:NTP pyrophosphatase (non-canonical NTP hydrolase)
MTITEMQQQTDSWIKQYGVRYFDVLTNIALLMEEVGEFARITARVYGEQSFRVGTEPADPRAMLADEMADILFVLTCMANQMDINLEQALIDNLKKKTGRDKDRHAQNPRLQ